MFLRLIAQSVLRQKRRKLLAGIAIALGMTIATAMLAIATSVGDKLNRELRAYGANIVIYPQEDTLDVDVGGVNLKPASQGAFLDQSDIPRIKGIFWRNNILGIAPFLEGRAALQLAGRPPFDAPLIGTTFALPFRLGTQTYTASVRSTHPWWKVEGNWPLDGDSKADAASSAPPQILVGRSLAASLDLHPGDTLSLAGRPALVTGILTASPAEDQSVVAALALVQQIIGRPGAVRRIYISALTKPEDAFARRDPSTMSPAVRDRWYCSPYAASIVYQLREALPNAHAEQVRQVAQNEGVVLSRITGLMFLITLAALLASTLAVSAAMATTIFERRREIGLLRSLGATSATVASLFYAEAGIVALAGGTVGFFVGALLARRLSLSIFGVPGAWEPVLLPIVLALALAVACAGSAVSIRRAMRIDPAIILRGDA